MVVVVATVLVAVLLHTTGTRVKKKMFFVLHQFNYCRFAHTHISGLVETVQIIYAFDIVEFQ